jgi:hypothetical protein
VWGIAGAEHRHQLLAASERNAGALSVRITLC